ncbi:hypothetical protein FEM48_Zijuj01G0247500 [Ziziphus jujuba var. spinosa]|uniref:Uncharacterized protein n=1 Tax=Ziziphus jujuba var. spinosa TaxID=714518 RepID=A0A978W4J3_ZIZJJ|nr:hypothetical protein FEM48_Zijuj01G0247500 [Ziziphus jujuba var. spinosa]
MSLLVRFLGSTQLNTLNSDLLSRNLGLLGFPLPEVCGQGSGCGMVFGVPMSDLAISDRKLDRLLENIGGEAWHKMQQIKDQSLLLALMA